MVMQVVMEAKEEGGWKVFGESRERELLLVNGDW